MQLLNSLLQQKLSIKLKDKDVFIDQKTFNSTRDKLITMVDHCYAVVHGLQENYQAYNKRWHDSYSDFDLEQIPLYLEESHTKNFTKVRFTKFDAQEMDVTFTRPPAF